MNKTQKRLVLAGLTVIVLILWIEPFREQNPFYFPVIDSMIGFFDMKYQTGLHAPDSLKNGVAVVLAALATAVMVYATRTRKLAM